MKMDGISQKRFLCLTPPSEADNRSAQARVLDALREEGLNARDVYKRQVLYCKKPPWG